MGTIGGHIELHHVSRLVRYHPSLVGVAIIGPYDLRRCRAV